MDGSTVDQHGVEEYGRGLQALRENKLEEAVQLIGQGLQEITEKFGEEAVEAAAAYHQYGLALFYRAQEESDVFGATLQSAVAKHEEGPSTSAAAAEEIEEDKADDGVGDGGEQKEGDSGAEEDEEEDEGPEDDMQLAWENLEVARKIYTDHQATHARELANVHMVLADLATEQESFEEALSDYQKAQELLVPLLKGNDRQLAELHFKTGLTLHFLNQPAEGLQEVRKAISICEAGLQDINTEQGRSSHREELEAVLQDLRAKEEELEDAVKEVAKTRNTLKAAFQSVMGGTLSAASPAAAATAPSQVMDLGVVGQGKKRINLAPIAQTAGKSNGTSAEGSKPRPKRSLEDLMGSEHASAGFAQAATGPGKKQAFAGAADAVAAVSTNPAPKQEEQSTVKQQAFEPESLEHT